MDHDRIEVRTQRSSCHVYYVMSTYSSHPYRHACRRFIALGRTSCVHAHLAYITCVAGPYNTAGRRVHCRHDACTNVRARVYPHVQAACSLMRPAGRHWNTYMVQRRPARTRTSVRTRVYLHVQQHQTQVWPSLKKKLTTLWNRVNSMRVQQLNNCSSNDRLQNFPFILDVGMLRKACTTYIQTDSFIDGL